MRLSSFARTALMGVAVLAATAIVQLWTSRSDQAQAQPVEASEGSAAPARPAASRAYPAPLDLADPTDREKLQRRYQAILARRDSVVPPAERTAMMRRFFDLDLWKGMYWFGIPVLKSPSDMWMMQQTIAEVRPDYIIEAGTYMGGSALYFASVLEGLGLPGSKVITIDITDLTKEASKHPLWQKHVEFIHGSSTDPAVVSRIGRRVEGGRVMVLLDSDHARDHVVGELRAYAPLVDVGSYLVVEDTSLDGIPLVAGYAGPNAALEDFLASEAGGSFQPDATREIFLVTFHPNGWLKRVR